MNGRKNSAQKARIASAGSPLVFGDRGSGTIELLASDGGGESANRGLHPAVEVAGPETGRDQTRDDPVRQGVGQGALEAVADLDSNLAFVAGDQQQHAVVNALAAEPPGFGDPDRVVLERVPLQGADGEHHHLGPGLPLQRFELLLEPDLEVVRQHARQVVDPASEVGNLEG